MYRKTWWLNPLSVYTFLMVVVLTSYNMTEYQYRVVYSSNKYISLGYVTLYMSSFFFFALGYAASKRYKLGKSHMIAVMFSEEEANLNSIYKGYKILFFICLLSYIIWYANFIRLNSFSILISFKSLASISNVMYIMRNNSGRIPGITTFTEVGMIVLPLGVYIIEKIKNKLVQKSIKKQIILIFLLATFRALAFSERVALLELLVPTIIMLIALRKKSKRMDFMIFFGPLMAVVMLVILFGAFEYSRSWLRFYSSVYDSFPEFIISRITGYYTNAINTECMYLSYSDMAVIPYRSIEWLWDIPGLSGLYDAIAPANVTQTFSSVLNTYGNPEYNNPGGILAFVVDFGIFFPVFEIIFGFLVGRVYKLFLHGNIFGMVIYSYIYVALLELPRYFLLGSSRSFCVFVGILIILFKTKKSKDVLCRTERM